MRNAHSQTACDGVWFIRFCVTQPPLYDPPVNRSLVLSRRGGSPANTSYSKGL